MGGMTAIICLLVQAIVNIVTFTALLIKTGDLMGIFGIFLGVVEFIVSMVSLFIARIDKKGN